MQRHASAPRGVFRADTIERFEDRASACMHQPMQWQATIDPQSQCLMSLEPASNRAAAHHPNHCIDRTLQEVVRVLDAHRDTHKVVGQAAGGPHLSRNGRMAHVAGQGDGGGDAAKADCNLMQLRLLCNCLAGLRAVCRHNNSD